MKKFQAAEDSRVIYVELTEQGKALQKLFEKISADLVQKVFSKYGTGRNEKAGNIFAKDSG